MAALDQLLMDLGGDAPVPVGKAEAPAPDRVLVRVPGVGDLVHPLPLPGGLGPEEWLAELAAVSRFPEGTEWCLAAADGAAHPSDTPGQLTEWSSVPTAPCP